MSLTCLDTWATPIRYTYQASWGDHDKLDASLTAWRCVSKASIS
jgi:hypothetical protein